MPKIHVITLRFKTSDGKDLTPVSFEVSDGEKGDKGNPGKDAYETWLELPGNAGKTKEQFIDYLKAEITILQATGNSTTAVMSQKATTDAVNTRVPTNRKINNKTLNVDLTLTPSDIGSYSIQQVDTIIEGLISQLNQNGETAAGVQADLNQFKIKVGNDYVLKTRTINSKPLSSNIVLTAGDIGTLTSQEITTLLAGKVGTGDARLTDAREWSTGTMTQSEAEGGTSTARRAVTAQRLRQANVAYTLSRSEIENIVGGLVPTSRTINSKPLTGNVVISASDVGAYSQSEINTKLNERIPLTSVVQATGTSTTNIMSQKATTDALATKAPTSHTHPWNQVTGQPATATRWPSLAEVTDKPTNYPTTWESVGSKPAQATRWPTFEEVTGKPSTYVPSAHTHTAAQVTGLGTAATATVTQTTGTSTTDVMSQKAVTDALSTSAVSLSLYKGTDRKELVFPLGHIIVALFAGEDNNLKLHKNFTMRAVADSSLAVSYSDDTYSGHVYSPGDVVGTWKFIGRTGSLGNVANGLYQRIL